MKKRNNIMITAMTVAVMASVSVAGCSVAQETNAEGDESAADIAAVATEAVIEVANNSTREQLPTDEDSMRDLSLLVYDANQLEALFANHDSVSYEMVMPLTPDLDYYVYETEDSLYSEWGHVAAQYMHDNVCYSSEYYEDYDYYDYQYIIYFDDISDLQYRFAGDGFDNFFMPESDTVTDCYRENGLIHIFTEFNDDLSESTLGMYGLEYDGNNVKTHLVFDADTYEIVAYDQTCVIDGEDTYIEMTYPSYDEPVPCGCRNLCAGFLRESEQSMTLTYIIDAGTSDESTIVVTVPINTEGGFMEGDIPYVYFDDEECTVLTHWDRMSDHTYYVFTYPDDELMEQYDAACEAVIAAMAEEAEG